MTAPTPADVPGRGEVEGLVARVLRETRINATGPGEVGCPLVKGWHSWTEHHAHVAAEVAKALAERDAEVARAERERVLGEVGRQISQPENELLAALIRINQTATDMQAWVIEIISDLRTQGGA